MSPPRRRSGPDRQPSRPPINQTPRPDQEPDVEVRVRLLPDGTTVDFADGYALGWAAGHEVGWHRGYGDSEREMAVAWHAMWRKVRAVLAQPTFAELQRRRGAA